MSSIASETLVDLGYTNIYNLDSGMVDWENAWLKLERYMEETEVVLTKKQPAITHSIQSWATPVVAVVMLIVGLLGGYYGRPLVGGAEERAEAPRTILPVQSQGVGAGNEELLDYLNSQVRHVTGKSDAPVTVIEFGDFQ